MAKMLRIKHLYEIWPLLLCQNRAVIIKLDSHFLSHLSFPPEVLICHWGLNVVWLSSVLPSGVNATLGPAPSICGHWANSHFSSLTALFSCHWLAEKLLRHADYDHDHRIVHNFNMADSESGVMDGKLVKIDTVFYIYSNLSVDQCVKDSHYGRPCL